MNLTVGGMTLQKLLIQHQIHTIRELSARTGLSRQHAWQLWHGYTGVGKATMQLLHRTLQIPVDELLQVDAVPNHRTSSPPKKRGRKPRNQQRPPEKESRHE
jgi:transcriptional regulator with XRE-family HTH domain